MKFTCENCGAQYLIADSKLGERGVKVRCKKCSYVIILRPSGWTPDQRKDAREEAPSSADIDPSPAYERPTIAAREAREKDAVAQLPSFPTGELGNEIAVAPDLGLSQEFAALGFSETNGGASELDSSPFAGRFSGGSLDQLPSFNVGGSAEVIERPNSDETEVLGRRPNLGSSMPHIEDDRVGDPTHVERVPMSDDEDTPLEMDAGGTGELNAALAKVQRNELLEMRSSLESDLEGLSSALDPRAKKQKQKAPNADAPAPDNGLHALERLASQHDAVADPNYNIADEARAEAEIGNAFEAMFEVPTDDGFGKGNRPDKLPTRVFDTEAMEKVEAEQAFARPSANSDQPSEWYVAIDDLQVGPMTVDEVSERWEAGELAADSLCWKQGLPDWQPIKSTVELRVVLGSMEDRERTVIATLQEDDSVPGGAVPPQISMHPDPPEREHSMGASSIGSDVGMDEPSWRPSAASALASLAAEELASAQSSAGIQAIKVQDIAVGAALPATSDALEKLLAGGAGTAAASQFGAAEKSESSVRPLPRRAEAITSMPLRDPANDRSRTSLMLPLSIVGAALVLVGGIAWVLSGKDDGAVAAVSPNSAQTPVAMVGGTAPPPAREASPAEVAKAVEPPATEVKTEKPPDTSAAAAKAEEKEEEDSEEEDGDKEAKKKKNGGTSKKKKSEKTPKPRKEKRELVDEPPPSLPRRSGDPSENEIDDLLGPNKGKRPSERTPIEDDVPRQLDDGEILKVLRTNRKSIIDCVKKQAAADSSVSGTMNVNMVITKVGQATRITVSPDRYSKTVAGKCVSSAVKNWKFPKFSGPNMPIDFPVRIR